MRIGIRLDGNAPGKKKKKGERGKESARRHHLDPTMRNPSRFGNPASNDKVA